jgi:tetratricopeptide (TPR) repeat protein
MNLRALRLTASIAFLLGAGCAVVPAASPNHGGASGSASQGRASALAACPAEVTSVDTLRVCTLGDTPSDPPAPADACHVKHPGKRHAKDDLEAGRGAAILERNPPDREKARAHFEDALTRFPESAWLRHEIACTYVPCNGRTRPSIVAFDKVVRGEDARASANYTRSALEIVEQGCPGDEPAEWKFKMWSELLDLYMFAGDRGRAEKVARDLLGAWPELTWAYLPLAEIQSELGDTRGSMDSLRKAFELRKTLPLQVPPFAQGVEARGEIGINNLVTWTEQDGWFDAVKRAGLMKPFQDEMKQFVRSRTAK